MIDQETGEQNALHQCLDECKELDKSFDFETFRAKNKITHGTPNLPVPSWGFKDAWALMIAALLAPLAAFLYLVTLLITFVPCILCSLYVCTLPRPLIRINRGCLFYILASLLAPFGALLMILAIFHIVWVYVVTMFLSLPVGILDCRMSIIKNLMTIIPYMKLQGYNWGDLVIAFLAMMHRQEFCEFWLLFPTVLTTIPILKYVFYCNIFLNKISVEFVNQWTDGFPELTERQLLFGMYRATSFTVNIEKNRKMIDDTEFMVIYQFPPQRRFPPAVTGLQFRRMGGVLFTRTEFAFPRDNVKSDTAKAPAMRIPLHYFNPFHVLTAYVEVNLTRDNGLEHPMWCAVGKSYYARKFYNSIHRLFHKDVMDEVGEFIGKNKEKDAKGDLGRDLNVIIAR
uniref:Uncharacterized protein n=1 Tax=Heterosigma akashiwo TaxID=2829 RepID=A0A6V1R1P7_HETAK|mmetsp:Transcript_23759/g.43543  ORF Transcript_23759/g.43543 Transcript_23759/m.43543 type:complete len:398 (-) Transcript_23759:199-1392(-)